MTFPAIYPPVPPPFLDRTPIPGSFEFPSTYRNSAAAATLSQNVPSSSRRAVRPRRARHSPVVGSGPDGSEPENTVAPQPVTTPPVLLEENVPVVDEPAIRDDPMPEETVPEENVPNDTVSEETAPGETAPAETVPEHAAASIAADAAEGVNDISWGVCFTKFTSDLYMLSVETESYQPETTPSFVATLPDDSDGP